MYSCLVDLHKVKPLIIVTGWTIVHSSPSTIIFIAVGLMFSDKRHIENVLVLYASDNIGLSFLFGDL